MVRIATFERGLFCDLHAILACEIGCAHLYSIAKGGSGGPDGLGGEA
ncbi:MAG TPA: hypothetical protein GX702_07255 [Chloroflexi bacterium]|jgi:hypothetical protein|nr:hypothetical protein [Chloroflexota bacterium]